MAFVLGALVMEKVNRLNHGGWAVGSKGTYRQISNISRTFVGNKIVYHSDVHVVGAWSVGEVWGVCCEFEVWFMFCCCRRIADGNIVMNWTLL